MFNLSLHSLNDEFCIKNGEVISAESFVGLVSTISAYLITQPDRVVLSFQDSYYFSAAVLAAMASEKKVIILPNNQKGTLEKFRAEYDSVLNDALVMNLPMGDALLEHFISPDASLVFFTSGSSGESKKVEKRFENFFAEVLELEATFRPRVNDSFIFSTVSHQHIYGFLFKVLWPTCMQRTWFASSMEYPEQITETAKQVSAFTLISTPAFLKRNSPVEKSIQNCQAVFSSGGLLSFEAATMTQQIYGVAPIEVYGSTESGGVGYRERVTDDQDWQTFSVVNISKNENDQLIVESPYIDEGSLAMGDRVEFTTNGFKLLGRVDDVVKIEDKRVSLSEMNARLLSSGFIKEAISIALEESGRQQVASVVVLSLAGEKLLHEKGSRALVNEIRTYLKNYFEAVVVPKKFRILDKLPYNEQSKLVKSELIGYFHEHG
jgi:Acyl-coenzyme A synthetases/AMP-(fatty) acid ligases